MTISNQAVEQCIEDCLQCLRWCSQCRAESLNDDPVMMRDCIRLCSECLEVCRTCVALLTGSSAFALRVMCSLRGRVREIRWRNDEEMFPGVPPVRHYMRPGRTRRANSAGCIARKYVRGLLFEELIQCAINLNHRA